LVLLGQAHVLRNQPGEARECFVKALRVRPSNPEALREMKRLEREKTAEKTVEGSLFNKLFGKR
jgi:Tfp pilus assembly protein PilF